MIYELRTYILRPGALPRYLEASAGYGRPARQDDYGKLEGHWSSPFGELNRLFTLWSYPSFAERERLRAALARNERWTKEFLPRIADVVLAKKSTILTPLRQVRLPAPNKGVYELRTDRVRSGEMREWVKGLERIAPSQEKIATNLGVWSTELGDLDTVVQLWAHESLDDLASAAKRLENSPELEQFLEQTAAAVMQSHCDVLVPTSLSPVT